MKVLLSGYYGFGNIGDEAVLEAIQAGIRARDPNAQIDILPKDRNAWPQIFSKIAGTDLLISGGGTLFQNATRNRSLLYYLAVIWLAKLLKKRVMILAQGFGPLCGVFYQRLTAHILNTVDSISLRDKTSFNAIRALGVTRPPMQVTADPAFLLNIPSKEVGKKLLGIEGVPDNLKLVGIAVRGVKEEYHAALAKVIDQLIKEHHYFPVFLPFNWPGDVEASQKVGKLMQEEYALVFRVCRPEEMLSIMGNLDLLIGMRLHSLIFATMNAVPMVGLSYDPKVEAFMENIGQPCVKMNEMEELEEKLSEVIGNKERVRKELREKSIELKAAAIIHVAESGKEVDFSGIKVDNVTLAEAAAKVEVMIAEKSPHLIVTPNPEIIVAAQDDAELKNIMNSSALRVPDGISMVVVSRILGRPLKERVSGIDLMLALTALSAQKGYKIFLLGGAPEVAKDAAKQLKNRFPPLQIVGTQDGFFSDDSEIIEKVKHSQPDILFVGLGGGRQEKWCNRHLNTLSVPVCMTIGGSLDVISGRKQRAPKWIQALYIEWLYRLITEPNRWRRQLALPKFLWLMFFG